MGAGNHSTYVSDVLKSCTRFKSLDTTITGNVIVPASRPRKFNSGVTLIEMMVSVILIGILLAITAPLGSLVETFRLDYFNQRLYSSSALARSEAIKRGVSVSLCRSEDGASCNNSDTNWSSGWLVFVNPNNNDSVDTGEDIIRIYNAVNQSLRVTWSAGNRLTFIPRGNPASSGHFTLCVSGRSGGTIKNVIVSGTGQIRKTTETGDCI